jgi:hypothetical protein
LDNLAERERDNLLSNLQIKDQSFVLDRRRIYAPASWPCVPFFLNGKTGLEGPGQAASIPSSVYLLQPDPQGKRKLQRKPRNMQKGPAA